MAKKKYIDYKKAQAELFKRTEGYAAKVRTIYREAMTEIINLVKGTELENGKPFSFTDYGFSDEVTPIFRSMYSKTYQTIRNGVEKEWITANENNDELVKSVFGEHSIEDNHFAKLFARNKEAMDAFFARKTGDEGLNLSQKVWRYTSSYKEELEDALDLAIGEGTAANRLATQIQKYLNEPDRFYRRFRVKVGEDEDGNPIYGRVWKRRIYDNESESYRWIDDNPKNYHPGKGVYRSSYRNAQRLARTETNIAYRTADYERWQELDFVVGIEIKLSNNHPTADICDTLKGRYPKDFKWTGWHPNCRCYQEPVLATADEIADMLDKILEGNPPSNVECENSVDDMPTQFKDWIKENEERMQKAEERGTLPYFVKDNTDLVDKALNGLSPEEEKALSMSDILVNPVATLQKYGMSDLEALYGSVKSKLEQITGGGNWKSQADSLEFEIKWVTDHKKYVTWEEAAKAYEKALAEIKVKIQRAELEADVKAIAVYAADSESIASIYTKLQAAYDSNQIDTVKALLVEAKNAVAEYNAELIKAQKMSVTELEKYCDEKRTFVSEVKGQKSFEKFQERMLKENEQAWVNGSDEARRAIIEYTNGAYEDINRSYWKYHTTHPKGEQMASIIDNIKTSKDMVLRRGCECDELGSIFGSEFGRLAEAGDIEGLNKLAGIRGVNEGFISTSFDMKGGFWKEVDLKIFAPKGTSAMYAKPVSRFGDYKGVNWDGKTASTIYEKGRENEVIVNKGYEYRFIKAEECKGKSSITIYIELLSRDKRVVK